MIRYSFSPERCARRVTETSENSIGIHCSELSRISVTSAMPICRRLSEPEKITSSVLRARTCFWDCSPSAQRIASATFDLPDPFGPAITVMPGPNSNRCRSANALKPWTSSRLRYT